jgi:hypothetical protein
MLTISSFVLRRYGAGLASGVSAASRDALRPDLPPSATLRTRAEELMVSMGWGSLTQEAITSTRYRTPAGAPLGAFHERPLLNVLFGLLRHATAANFVTQPQTARRRPTAGACLRAG